MKAEWKNELKNVFDWKKLFWVIFGNTAYCFGIVAFVLPMGLITGGTTGLGLIANILREFRWRSLRQCLML